DLARHALIVGPAGRSTQGWTFLKPGKTHVMRVTGRYMLDSTEAATAAAVNGLGIVSTGTLACLDELQRGSLIKLLPDWAMEAVDIYIVLAEGRSAKPSARAFAEFFRKDFRSR